MDENESTTSAGKEKGCQASRNTDVSAGPTCDIEATVPQDGQMAIPRLDSYYRICTKELPFVYFPFFLRNESFCSSGNQQANRKSKRLLPSSEVIARYSVRSFAVMLFHMRSRWRFRRV
jgi:hypothetical protein